MTAESQIYDVVNKEFLTSMYRTCYNECISAEASSSLTATEGKCLKACYTGYKQKFFLAQKIWREESPS